MHYIMPFLVAYDYDIKERIEKIRMNVVIMLGGNEIYAKNFYPSCRGEMH